MFSTLCEALGTHSGNTPLFPNFHSGSALAAWSSQRASHTSACVSIGLRAMHHRGITPLNTGRLSISSRSWLSESRSRSLAGAPKTRLSVSNLSKTLRLSPTGFLISESWSGVRILPGCPILVQGALGTLLYHALYVSDPGSPSLTLPVSPQVVKRIHRICLEIAFGTHAVTVSEAVRVIFRSHLWDLAGPSRPRARSFASAGPSGLAIRVRPRAWGPRSWGDTRPGL